MREYKITLLDEPSTPIVLTQSTVDQLYLVIPAADYKPMIQKDLIDFAIIESSDGKYFFGDKEAASEESQIIFETILSNVINHAVEAARCE